MDANRNAERYALNRVTVIGFMNTSLLWREVNTLHGNVKRIRKTSKHPRREDLTGIENQYIKEFDNLDFGLITDSAEPRSGVAKDRENHRAPPDRPPEKSYRQPHLRNLSTAVTALS
jgi:hypothetical protein